MGDTGSKSATVAEMQDWVDVSEPNVTTAAGVVMPRLIYGTAWKETRVGPGATARLVVEAVQAGFTGIDTACQPKHYHEPGVGEALRQLFSEGVGRGDLFIQTKFSRNQDLETIPYSAMASIPAQVAESMCEFSMAPLACSRVAVLCNMRSSSTQFMHDVMSAISLANLGVEYVDSLVLHSPYPTHSDTMQAWRAMETTVEAGQCRQLGISNVKAMSQLERLWDEATVKPAVVQMRFHAKTNFEREMRAWCSEKGESKISHAEQYRHQHIEFAIDETDLTS